MTLTQVFLENIMSPYLNPMPCSDYKCFDVDESTVRCECKGYKCRPPEDPVAGKPCHCDVGFYEANVIDNCFDAGTCYNATLGSSGGWEETCKAVGPECVVRSGGTGCVCNNGFQDSKNGCVKYTDSSLVGGVVGATLFAVFIAIVIAFIGYRLRKRASLKGSE